MLRQRRQIQVLMTHVDNQLRFSVIFTHNSATHSSDPFRSSLLHQTCLCLASAPTHNFSSFIKMNPEKSLRKSFFIIILLFIALFFILFYY